MLIMIPLMMILMTTTMRYSFKKASLVSLPPPSLCTVWRQGIVIKPSWTKLLSSPGPVSFFSASSFGDALSVESPSRVYSTQLVRISIDGGKPAVSMAVVVRRTVFIGRASGACFRPETKKALLGCTFMWMDSETYRSCW